MNCNDAEKQRSRVMAAMRDGMMNDARFRALVDSCVAAAMSEIGGIDPDDAQRGAYECARFAAALLLARVYDEDGELAAMREQRDRAMDFAQNSALFSPPTRLVIEKPTA